jgi:hypothetical protein
VLGQLNFEELLKETDYFARLKDLLNMQLNEEREFNTPDCKVSIKYVGPSAWSDRSYNYKTSIGKYGCSFNANSLAGCLVIGFNHTAAKCKWINHNPIPWEIMEV